VSKKKQKQMMEDEAVDKLDLFLAQNSKKLLGGLALLLIVFLAGYAFNTMTKSKNQLLISKVGQLEMIMDNSNGSKENLDKYLAMANDLPKVGDYINLKAGETLVNAGKTKEALEPLNTAGGDFKEMADGLKFDTGLATVNAESYLETGKMGSLWYYRAYMSADEAKKKEILETFKTKYPNNDLLKQLERWNG